MGLFEFVVYVLLLAAATFWGLNSPAPFHRDWRALLVVPVVLVG